MFLGLFYNNHREAHLRHTERHVFFVDFGKTTCPVTTEPFEGGPVFKMYLIFVFDMTNFILPQSICYSKLCRHH